LDLLRIDQTLAPRGGSETTAGVRLLHAAKTAYKKAGSLLTIMRLMIPDSKMSSKKYALFAALAGVVLACFIGYFILHDMEQNQEIQSMKGTIKSLQSSLAKEELKNARLNTHQQRNINTTIPGDTDHPNASDKKGSGQSATDNATGSLQILKDLESVSDADPRSYSEKLQDLLSGSPTEERAAIASRFIFNKARDQQGLPDYALQTIYASQSNPDLKRVIAQVLSQRGNNALLNSQIAEAQTRLKSEHPGDRLETLGQLGKMHTTKAVDAIAPFLEDPDTTVRLAALFALRDTGNQQHVGLVEAMINDPDPSVSTLASDVLSSLRNLSSSARTNYSRSDIESELPPIANP